MPYFEYKDPKIPLKYGQKYHREDKMKRDIFKQRGSL